MVELLVVIAIIGILAAMVLTAVTIAKRKAQIKKARMQLALIVGAIHDYEAAYSHYPVSADAVNAAAAANNQDFTYGTANVANNNIKTPGASTVYNVYALDDTTGQLPYQANNSEVMAILLDVETCPGTGAQTVNFGHVKNPQKTKFLNADMVSDPAGPGIGPDLVYRDPWGNPYIITIDLNFDERARDAFYRTAAVSADASPGVNPKPSINGLIPRVLAGGATVYEANSPVMVWSAGPDKMVDPGGKANQGANKDNVISWK